MPWPSWISTAAASSRRLWARRQDSQAPWREVPRGALALALALLIAQAGVGLALRPRPEAVSRPLPPSPPPAALALLSGGDARLAQTVGLIWLQSFDRQPGLQLALRSLDDQRLAGWLDALARLDPASDYPVMLAANIYFPHGSAARRDRLAPWIEARFLEAPDRRWPYLAYSAVLLRRDAATVGLARRWAALIRQHARAAPSWARQLEAFIAEATGDDRAAAALLALMLRDGIYKDEAEARFLLERLQEIEARLTR